MITVLTAAYGEDKLQAQPPQEGVDVRWLAITDHDDHPLDAKEQWEPLFEPRPHLSPRMAAKIPKYLPGHYVPVPGATVVWMDCSVLLTSPHAIERFTLAASWGFNVLPHPDRRRVADEWPEAAAQGRYAGQMVKEQYEFYASNPEVWEDNHLWATTIIVQTICQEHHIFGYRWLVENCIWSAQDQISLPWLSAQTGMPIVPITLDLWNNPYFTLRQREKDV